MTATLAERTRPAEGASAAAGGRVGPNAVLQLAATLRETFGEAETAAFFAAAGAGEAYARPPDAMVDECVAARLFLAAIERYGRARGGLLLGEAGRRTGDYIADNRIPALAKGVLGVSPRRLAAPLLLKAIEASAWTFAGSGLCRARSGRPAVIDIKANPIATPDCPWHRGAFEQLFRRLLGGRPVAHHPLCCARGDEVCRFEIVFEERAARSLANR